MWHTLWMKSLQSSCFCSFWWDSYNSQLVVWMNVLKMLQSSQVSLVSTASAWALQSFSSFHCLIQFTFNWVKIRTHCRPLLNSLIFSSHAFLGVFRCMFWLMMPCPETKVTDTGQQVSFQNALIVFWCHCILHNMTPCKMQKSRPIT